MRPATLFGAALIVASLAACSALTPRSSASPTPLPPTDLTVVGNPADQSGSFFMATGQTLLVELPFATSHDAMVLAIAGHYPGATVFKAVGVGRTWVVAERPISCPSECNALGPLQVTIVVVSDLQRGLVISEQDLYSIIHLRSGQRFLLTLRNRAGAQAWAGLTSANPAVIVPEQPAAVTPDGIQGQFRAGQVGRTGVYASGPPCPSGSACPQSPYASFTFEVFL